MITRTAVVVERRGNRATRAAVQRVLLYLRTVGYETSELASIEASGRGGSKFLADVVLLGSGSGKTSRLVAKVKHLCEVFPKAHVFKQAVDDFHDHQTGRLNAARVAQAYGVSLSALARALKVTQSALSKRPMASAAQLGLRELEFAWAALIDAVESPERVRAWLHARRPDLSGKPPIILLLEGSAEGFANYVRSVVAGEPG